MKCVSISTDELNSGLFEKGLAFPWFSVKVALHKTFFVCLFVFVLFCFLLWWVFETNNLFLTYSSQPHFFSSYTDLHTPFLFAVGLSYLFFLQAIKSEEQTMKGILTTIMNLLPEAYQKTKNKLEAEQFLAVLQGITGFSGAVAGKDPFAFIDSAVGIMDYEINKPCLKSLGTIRKNLKKWLTFGKEYKPLKDSSDLNFDLVKVSAIPEVMKVYIFSKSLIIHAVKSR